MIEQSTLNLHVLTKWPSVKSLLSFLVEMNDNQGFGHNTAIKLYFSLLQPLMV